MRWSCSRASGLLFETRKGRISAAPNGEGRVSACFAQDDGVEGGGEEVTAWVGLRKAGRQRRREILRCTCRPVRRKRTGKKRRRHVSLRMTGLRRFEDWSRLAGAALLQTLRPFFGDGERRTGKNACATKTDARDSGRKIYGFAAFSSAAGLALASAALGFQKSGSDLIQASGT